MPQVNSQVILWARENAGLSADEAAAKLSIADNNKETAVEKLHGYENGAKEPSRALLKKMSTAYRVPLLSFYLNKPPTRPDRGEDFRTLPDDIKDDNAFLVDTLIRNIRVIQSTLRQVLIEQDEAQPIEFVGSLSMDDGVETVAEKIIASIGFDLQAYREEPDHHRAFKYLRKLSEDAGVYIILKSNLGSHHSNIEVKAFRGIALADNIVPFIVLNDKDAKSAWSFSILHELAHIVLGQTGVSGTNNEQQIERFCNQVASEILIPDLSDICVDMDDMEHIIHEVTAYASKWNVSHTQLAYRLYLRGDYSFAAWQRLSDYFRQLWITQRDTDRRRQQEAEGRPAYSVLKRYRLGDALVKTVDGFLRSGAITTTKAGLLLETRPLKVDSVLQGSFSMEGR